MIAEILLSEENSTNIVSSCYNLLNGNGLRLCLFCGYGRGSNNMSHIFYPAKTGRSEWTQVFFLFHFSIIYIFRKQFLANAVSVE